MQLTDQGKLTHSKQSMTSSDRLSSLRYCHKIITLIYTGIGPSSGKKFFKNKVFHQR